jgi:hypothetical protein
MTHPAPPHPSPNIDDKIWVMMQNLNVVFGEGATQWRVGLYGIQ